MFDAMRDPRALALAALLALPLSATLPGAAYAVDAVEAEEEREQIPWDLTDLYESNEAWDASRQNVLNRLPELEAYQGRLSEGPEVLLEAMELSSELLQETFRAYVYPNLLFDEDQNNSDASGMTQQANDLYSAFQSATAWSSPEILAMGEAAINEFIATNPEAFERFRLSLMNIVRNEPYILSPDGERIMAAAGILDGQPSQTYGLLLNADITWPTITLSDGEEVYLNQSGYSFNRANQNRDDRIAVFDTFWAAMEQYEASVGQILNHHIQNQVFVSRARGYDNTLQMNLFSSNIPEDVYTTLVEQVNDMLPLYHRYLALRARLLGVDDLGYHDSYPEALELDRIFDIYDSRATLIEAAVPLGEDFVERLDWATGQGWEHVYPEDGKETGAYQWGVYGTHPYILLNHQDDYESMTTYAHEWGHGMHTLLAEEANPFETADYDTFIAEVASISHEVLLEEHVLANTESDEELLYYIDRILGGYRGTLFRQTMFAEAEHAFYREVEEGRPLTGARLSEIYLEIVRRYHGHDDGVMNVADQIKMEWAYIPHFYRNYYVFQYSTSQVQSDYFMGRVLSGEEGAVENFLNVLSSGGNNYPNEIVLNAGLDMSDAAAYGPTRDRMTRLLDRYEELLNSLGY